MNTISRLVALLALAGAYSITLLAQAPSTAIAANPTLAASDYVIGPQDVLTIQVFDQADLGGKYAVEADGTFTFPLVGRVTAGGMTLRNFEGELRRKLADGYFKNPQVSVAIEQYRSQRVFVMGEVRAPGPVALTGNMSLVEALSRAGSTLPSASGEVAIVRAAKDAKGPTLPDATKAAEMVHVSIRELESGAMKHNVELHDGDTIFVPRAESAYVFGEVKSPGAYSIQKDTTVLQALSLAGGLTENGAMNRIKIVRLVNGEKKDIKVKDSEVSKLVVKAGDTIIVPQKFF
jgi:polysaccharide export outer membrane protein